ncbi:sigma-70 family RNA polymerase sigma factor [Micromonospora sp. WMMD882]|uniref:RNA polymerase sigma factor n=1 Tax=Micromonospora sp. WMMD882 TaxID=3015151 RepID=UPI00248B92E3|nr:sigma-70 family RNA polymerase sigma factor [Micromonospora sp. WMMD882]WBB78086.1 sigma-70 family RNA polymerase sigma factor [Micromonospora sp. WMMD882]
MNVESNVPGEQPEPDESAAGQPSPPGDGTGVSRDLGMAVLPSPGVVDQQPRWVITNESGDAVRGEIRLPEAAPEHRTAFDFDEFYVTYYDRLVGALYSYCAGDRVLAEDVAQATFLKAFEHRDELATKLSPYAWLRTVAIRAAQDVFRGERRRKTREQERELLVARIDEWEARAWLLAIRELPEPENRVLWSRFVLGYERQVIADELGMSLRSVDHHIKRGVGRLRRNIGLGGED